MVLLVFNHLGDLGVGHEVAVCFFWCSAEQALGARRLRSHNGKKVAHSKLALLPALACALACAGLHDFFLFHPLRVSAPKGLERLLRALSTTLPRPFSGPRTRSQVHKSSLCCLIDGLMSIAFRATFSCQLKALRCETRLSSFCDDAQVRRFWRHGAAPSSWMINASGHGGTSAVSGCCCFSCLQPALQDHNARRASFQEVMGSRCARPPATAITAWHLQGQLATT